VGGDFVIEGGEGVKRGNGGLRLNKGSPTLQYLTRKFNTVLLAGAHP